MRKFVLELNKPYENLSKPEKFSVNDIDSGGLIPGLKN